MNTNDIPMWEKYTLTIEEAFKYFRIGEKKLRKLAEKNPDAGWLIMNGIMSEKRRDSKGRILRTGASQRKDGRYAYQYTDAYGKPQFVYSWRPVATDKTPAGSGTISRPGKR